MLSGKIQPRKEITDVRETGLLPLSRYSGKVTFESWPGSISKGTTSTKATWGKHSWRVQEIASMSEWLVKSELGRESQKEVREKIRPVWSWVRGETSGEPWAVVRQDLTSNRKLPGFRWDQTAGRYSCLGERWWTWLGLGWVFYETGRFCDGESTARLW